MSDDPAAELARADLSRVKVELGGLGETVRRLVEEVRRLLIFTVVVIVVAAGLGFGSGWILAAEYESVGAWPGLAVAGASLFAAALGFFWLENRERWSRNVEVVKDNILLGIITTGVGIGLFLLGLALG